MLLLANLIIHWPGKKHPAAPGPLGMGGAPPPEIQAQIDAAIQKLPEDQRIAASKRMEEERAFFDSVKTMPEQERQQKIQEHFAQNPMPQIPGVPSPPPGSAPGANGTSTGGNGGPGPGGGSGGDWMQSGHIPQPEARHSMDQNIVNSQKSAAAQ